MVANGKMLADVGLSERVLAAYLRPEKPQLELIQQEFGLTYSTVIAMLRRHLSPERYREEKAIRYSRSKTGDKNPMRGMTGSKHHNFKGRCLDSDGYVIVLRPEWFTGRVTQKHVFEHHVVMCLLLGTTSIPQGMQVHHIDENKTNNESWNLALVTAGAHRRIHARSPLRRLSLWELHRSGISKLM